jgi:hypothetical protein
VTGREDARESVERPGTSRNREQSRRDALGCDQQICRWKKPAREAHHSKTSVESSRCRTKLPLSQKEE